MTDKFLKFLQWEEENASAYFEQEKQGEPTGRLHYTSDYWRGYADAVANALAAYAGPTDIDEVMGATE